MTEATHEMFAGSTVARAVAFSEPFRNRDSVFNVYVSAVLELGADLLDLQTERANGGEPLSVRKGFGDVDIWLLISKLQTQNFGDGVVLNEHGRSSSDLRRGVIGRRYAHERVFVADDLPM